MPRLIAFACFLLSGAAGLVYEICWIRLAGHSFGSTTLALSTVVGVFFGGIALGSFLFGRWSQRWSRPLRVYALLELALAVIAVLSPLAFGLGESVYGGLYRALGSESVGAVAAMRFAVLALLLLLPSTLMGGTFPLFCRQFANRNLVGSIGLLYGINTLGAAFGALGTGFLLLPHLGVRGSLWLGAALSLAAGLGALALARGLRIEPADAEDDAGDGPAAAAAAETAAAPQFAWIGTAFFAVGFAAVGVQVLWSRFLGLIVRNTVHTTAITLGTVLLGIVLGALLAAAALGRTRRPGVWFGGLAIAFGLAVQVLMRLPPTAFTALGSETLSYVLLMLPPMVLSGALFPLGIRMAARPDARDAGAVAGRMTALNTFGGICGSLLAGFALLPYAGLSVSLHLFGGVSVVVGLRALRQQQHPVPLLLGTALAGAFAMAPALLDTRLPADFLASREALVAFREGHTAQLAVTRRDGVRQLDIDRWWQGSEEQNHQTFAAHLPMLLHPDPQSVLVVGVGTGQAPSRFLLHEPAHLDCVDIEPALFPFVAEHFDSDWMDDPRVRRLATDGRHHVVHAERRYDVVSIEIGQLFRPGAAAFYTAEFYAGARARLTDGGVIAQFVPLAFLDPTSLRQVIATFRATWPECALFYNTQELLLLGRQGAPLRLTAARIAAAGQGAVGRDLGYAHWGGEAEALRQPHALLATFLCGPEGLAELAPDDTPLLTDDLPALEFQASAVQLDDRMEREAVPLLESVLSPVTAITDTASLPADTLARATALRQAHLAALRTAADVRLARRHLRRGDRTTAQRLARDAVAAAPRHRGALRLLGNLEDQAGNATAAEQAYRQALAVRPDDALCLRGLGLVLLRTDRAEEAVRTLDRARARRPQDAVTLNYLGAALARTGDYPGGLKRVEEALALWPEYPSALKHRDTLARALGR